MGVFAKASIFGNELCASRLRRRKRHKEENEHEEKVEESPCPKMPTYTDLLKEARSLRRWNNKIRFAQHMKYEQFHDG